MKHKAFLALSIFGLGVLPFGAGHAGFEFLAPESQANAPVLMDPASEMSEGYNGAQAMPMQMVPLDPGALSPFPLPVEPMPMPRRAVPIPAVQPASPSDPVMQQPQGLVINPFPMNRAPAPQVTVTPEEESLLRAMLRDEGHMSSIPSRAVELRQQHQGKTMMDGMNAQPDFLYGNSNQISAQNMMMHDGMPQAQHGFTPIQGFGRDLPLVTALQQVVPENYTYVFQGGVNPGVRVSWQGGKPWDIVLSDMLGSQGLQGQVRSNKIFISMAGQMNSVQGAMGTNHNSHAMGHSLQPMTPALSQPVMYAPAPDHVGFVPSPPSTHMGAPIMPNSTAMVPQTNPVLPAPTPHLGNNFVSRSSDIGTEVPRSSFELQSTQLANATARDERLTGQRLTIDPNPMAQAQTTSIQNPANQPVEAQSYRHDQFAVIEPAPLYTQNNAPIQANNNKGAPINPVPPKMLESLAQPAPSYGGQMPVAVPNTQTMPSQMHNYSMPSVAIDQRRTWRAVRGDSLKTVLQDWSRDVGVELYWNSEFDYPLDSSLRLDGTFEEAVQNLLTGLRDASPRPVGRLHPNKPQGPAVLIVESEQIIR